MSASDNTPFATIVVSDESQAHLSSKEKPISNSSRATKRSSSCLKTSSSQENAVSTSPDDGLEALAAIPIQLPDSLKQHLEDDYINVCKKRKLSIVPAAPNILSVLEDFVRHYGMYRRYSRCGSIEIQFKISFHAPCPNIFFFFQKLAAAKMVSYEKQRSKTFYTSNRREEDKLCFEKAVDAINMAKEVRG